MEDGVIIWGGRCTDKYEFEKQYKFHLCFENTSASGYTTEKIINAFAAGGIPIYWGDPTITEMINPRAFVNVMAYESLDDVVKEVIRLDNDDLAYRKMLDEPVFMSSEWEYEHKYNELRAFVKHIIEQSKTDAYRFNRGYCGTPYYEKMYYSRMFYSKLQLFKNNPIKGSWEMMKYLFYEKE